MNPRRRLADDRRGGHSVRVTRHLQALAVVGAMCFSLAPWPAAQASVAADAGVQRTALTTISASSFEQRLFLRTNKRRAAHGCRALRQNSALELAAARHSSLMSLQGSLSHRLAGEPDMVARDVAAGYTPWRLLAENLAWGQSTPRAVFRAWVRSPGHRANLDNCRLRDVGFGVVIRNGRPWVTADFGRHR